MGNPAEKWWEESRIYGRCLSSLVLALPSCTGRLEFLSLAVMTLKQCQLRAHLQESKLICVSQSQRNFGIAR